MKKIFIIVLLIVFAQIVLGQNIQKGKIAGTIVDSETGNPIIGANIYLENTSLGSASDVEGRYLILNVPSGEFVLVVSVVGYAETKVNHLEVNAKQTTKLNLTIKPEIMTSKVVVIEAKAIENTEAALLKFRQKSVSVSDAVSAEAMSRAGSSTAADAMKQVTGASVVDGKYVYVRGLGDRYTSTQLNGAELPSTDPYRRSGSIDLIPSSLVDNITTTKSFTPDKPGNFSGGTVDIKTKDFPDRLSFSAGISSSFNTQTSYNDNGVIGNTGSSTDWLGFDDGARDLPEIVKNYNSDDPLDTRIEMTRAFSRELGPSYNNTFPMNRALSLSFGNQISLFGRTLGFLASASYRRDYSSFNGGIQRRWNQGMEQATALTNVYDLKDTQSKDEILWGGLLKASYRLSPNHIFSMNGMYNQNGENKSRFLEGKYPYDLDENKIFQTSVLSYNERTLKSAQLEGDHNFPALFNVKISWKASLGSTHQNEPDLRYFTNYYQWIDGEKDYGIKGNTPPKRYYRNLNEERSNFTLDIELPFKQWYGRSANIKIGGLSAQKNRDYCERLFDFVQEPFFKYNGNPNDLLSPDNIGLLDSNLVTIRGVEYVSYVYGVLVQESTLPAANYNAAQDVSAAYAMFDLPLIGSLRFIGGARLETTDMWMHTQDDKLNLNQGEIRTKDILPSVNFIYSITDNMNLRAAYSKTLAKPTFREIGPFPTYDFIGEKMYIGNQNLERTLIENFDLRWEWFSRPGEIYALSAFYKDFTNPIERVINVDEENTWKNVDAAHAFGLEFEIRKNLDILSEDIKYYLSSVNIPLISPSLDILMDNLKYFLLGANLSLISSSVDISEDELFLLRIERPDAPDTRQFQGQSPYLLNLNLTYDNPQIGIMSNLYYNVFGERLYKVSYAKTPDVYEQPVGMLNFSFGWKFTNHMNFKFSAKNILDPYYKKTQEFKGREYIYSQYKRGRSFSIGIGYQL
jgi:TonB-dependent receptor